MNLRDDGLIRLQAALAHAGVASRRACETLITDGRVSVNGVIVTELGTKVAAADVLCVDGKPVAAEEKKRYVLLNKPAGYVCSLSDEKGRPVAADLLREHFSERLYNVGRLDMYSSGLILFTNDGEFAAQVSHPSAELEKEYVVETSLPFPRELCERFKRGVRVDKVFYRCAEAERLSARRLRVVLIEGKNREIRRVLEFFGVRVKTLVRTRIGPLTLASGETPQNSPNPQNGVETLQGGQWRELTAAEVDGLLAVCRLKRGLLSDQAEES